MAHILGQVHLMNDTALPEDVTINTFHYSTGVASALAGAIEAANLVFNFYDVPAPGRTNSISDYLSSRVQSTLGYTSRWYNMADPPPRVPVFIDGPKSLVVSSQALPGEVALVSSFQAAPASGSPQARRRGRIFLGPLGLICNDSATGRPTTAVLDDVRLNTDLLATNSTVSATWCVFSRVDNVLYPVTNGWVDNAFDTQRRRGERATARQVWAV